MNTSFEDRPISEPAIPPQPPNVAATEGEMQGRKVERQTHALPNIEKAAKKAFEAEDILTPKRPPLPRQLSVKSVKEIAQEQEAIEAKNGPCWNCIGRSPLKEGEGFLYRFELKEEFRPKANIDENTKAKEAFDKEENRIYPAIVPNHELLMYYFSSSTDSSTTQFLRRLGYEYKDGVLTLPDREALIALYEKERNSRPELPELHIANETGIATDSEFVEAFYTSDVLLSSGKEFVHDHIFHVIRLLEKVDQLTNSKALYSDAKSENIMLLTNMYRKLGMVKHLQSEYIAKVTPSTNKEAIERTTQTLEGWRVLKAERTLQKTIKELTQFSKPSENIKQTKIVLDGLLSRKALETPEAKKALTDCSEIMWHETQQHALDPRPRDISDDILSVLDTLEKPINPQAVEKVFTNLASPSTKIVEKLEKSIGLITDNISANTISPKEVDIVDADITKIWEDALSIAFFQRSFPTDTRPFEIQMQELKDVWSFLKDHLEG